MGECNDFYLTDLLQQLSSVVAAKPADKAVIRQGMQVVSAAVSGGLNRVAAFLYAGMGLDVTFLNQF